MVKDYVHLPVNEEVNYVTGWYEPEREESIQVNGDEVLYVIGSASLESSCVGGGRDWRYALVPGYVRRFKYQQNPEGLWVSEVEPISDREERRRITRILEGKESIGRVDFS